MAVCAATLGASATDMTEPMTLSDVSYRQDRRTQKVHVSYSLANQGEPAYVVMDVLTNGVSIGMEKIKTFESGSAVSQFDGGPVTEGTGKSIVWNARKDWRGNLSTNATVQLSAYYTNRFGVYMVVDISGGPTATRYPVTYTMDAPDFDTDISCASNKVWLKRVKAGTFRMGSPSDEVGRSSNETLHDVTLTKPFYAGVFPVTLAQYCLVIPTMPVRGLRLMACLFPCVNLHGLTFVAQSRLRHGRTAQRSVQTLSWDCCAPRQVLMDSIC